MYNKYLLYLLLAFNFVFTFAAGCGLSGTEDPDPAEFACILEKIITIAIVVAGLIFIAMVSYGGVKLALAFGDPKGYAGAISTWQYALIGVFVIILIGGVLSVVGKLIGVNIVPTNLISELRGAIDDLVSTISSGN